MREILDAIALAFVAVLLATLCSTSAGAKDERAPRHYEFWSGTDVGENVWLIYSGVTLAPFSDMHANGLRVRFAAGHGQYRYKSFNDTTLVEQKFEAQTSFGEGLVGYLWRLDPLIVKAFAGVSAIEHRIAPFDPQNRAQGLDYGVKGVIELWFNISPKAWSSLDLAWSSAHNSRSARARIGYRVWPELSLGLEGGANVDIQGEYKIKLEREAYASEELDYSRVGGFARYEWDGGELSASAGMLGDFTEHRTVYGTVNWLTQF